MPQERPTRRAIRVTTQSWSGPAAYTAGASQGQYIEGRKIELDFSHGGKTYRVILTSIEGAHWSGIYTIPGQPPQLLEAKLYTATDGDMLLIGHWFENGAYTWIAHIQLDD